MNLRQLEAFIAIVESGSFSRAAEAVSLNQSTISQHIAALENELGTTLLDRTGKGALPTASGRIFLQHARRILSERDALYQSMSGFQGLQNVSLQVGASNIPATYLVPALLPDLVARHPGINLIMTSGDSRDVLDALVAAEIELGLVGSRFDHKGVDYTPLVTDRLVLVVGSGHRWREKSNVTLEELAAEPVVVRESGSGTGRTVEIALSRAGLDTSGLRVAARLGSNEAVLQAVAGGFGCAFVSELSIRDSLMEGKICQVDVRGLSIERRIWLVAMRDRSLSPAAEAFREMLSARWE